MYRLCKFYIDDKGEKRLNFSRFTGQEMYAISELSTLEVEGDDIRFALVSRPAQGAEDIRHGFMVDLDQISPDMLNDHDTWALIYTAVVSIFPKECHVVFSGGGLHFYFEVVNPIPQNEWSKYKTDLGLKLNKLSAMIGHVCKVDNNVDMRYGRVPGSYNVKRECPVSYLCKAPGTKIENFSDFFQEIEKVKRISVPSAATLVEGDSDRLLKSCRFLQDVKEDNSEHDKWATAMHICHSGGHKELAHELSQGPDYDFDAVEEKMKADKAYHFSCAKVSASYPSICKGCVHFGRPKTRVSQVSGFRPCETKKTGFHPVDKAGFPIEDRITSGDLVAHYYNVHEGDLYKGTGTPLKWEDGKFVSVLDGSSGDMTHDTLEEMRSYTGIGSIRKVSSYNEVSGLLSMCESLPKLPKFEHPERYVSVQNGVVDMDTKELLPHSKDRGVLVKCPVEYDPDADCPEFKRYIEELFPDERDREIVQTFLGLSVSPIPNNEAQQFLYIHGAPGMGKSTLTVIFRELAGQDQTINLGPASFTENGSAIRVNPLGKSLAICDDLKLPKNQADAFLTGLQNLTTGENINVRQMKTDPYPVRGVCSTVIVSSNYLLPVPDFSSGILRRQMYVNTYNAPKNMDRKLLDKIRKEMPGVLNYALEGLERFRKYGVPSLKTEVKEYLEGEVAGDAKGVKEYIELGFEFDPTYKGVQKASDLRKMYANFVDDEEIASSDRKFVEAVKGLLSKELSMPIYRVFEMRARSVYFRHLRPRKL